MRAADYPNGYNWVRLDLEAGEGVVILRTYSDHQGGFWARDTLTYRNVDKGEFRFPLPLPGGKPARKGRPPVALQPAVSEIELARLEANYLRRLQATANALPLAVIDPRAVERVRQQTLDLLKIYVALNTRTQVAGEKLEAEGEISPRPSEAMIREERESRLLPALEAAAREPYLVILGDPGSGKSTFANHLALCLAGARLEEAGEPGWLPGDGWLDRLQPAWTHGPLLPVQVVLRQFAKSERCRGSATGLWDFIVETLASQELADFAPGLRQQLLKGGVLVLLDGLDEVADPAQRQIVRDAVADFTATFNHPENRYLVTCRGYAYQDACCQLDRFKEHTLAPFDQKQIAAFIDCWYGEVCRLGWKSEAEAAEEARRLREAVAPTGPGAPG